MTGVAAASSTLGNCGRGALRRVTPTTVAGLDTDAEFCTDEAGGASLSCSGRDVPCMAIGGGGPAGLWAALTRSSELACSYLDADAVSSGRLARAGAVEFTLWRVWACGDACSVWTRLVA